MHVRGPTRLHRLLGGALATAKPLETQGKRALARTPLFRNSVLFVENMKNENRLQAQANTSNINEELVVRKPAQKTIQKI